MTCTTPNRLYLWSGTIRAKPDISAKANLHNEDADFDTQVDWTTFPERLEEHGISWRVYQNEIYLPTGLRARRRRGYPTSATTRWSTSSNTTCAFPPRIGIIWKSSKTSSPVSLKI